MEILKISKKICPCCMEEHEVPVVLVQEKNVFKGVEVTYSATYEYCERCDEYNATEEMITANDIAIKNAYRNKMGLLTSDKIIALRKKYAISQSDLCTLLAWGKKTITRYEGHQVQDAAHDKILRKLDSDPEWFLSLLEKAKNEFSEAAYKKYFQNALKLFEASKDLYLQKAVGAHYVCSEESESYGGDKLSLLAKRKAAQATDEKLKSDNGIKANKKNTQKVITENVTKVKELFLNLDKEDIIKAYRLMFDIIPSYEQVSYTIPELIKADKKFDEKARILIDDIIVAEKPNVPDDDMVIFVIQLASEDYDDKTKKSFHSMALYENEFREKAGKDFQVWASDGEETISHYAYDMETLERIANFRIADQSVEECSAVVCAAVIFNEITFHGYDKERRQENIEKLKKELRESLDEIDESKTISAEEFFEKMHRDLLDSIEDEDERRYYELEHDFEKSVEDIKRKWRSQIMETNHQKVIKHIKAEWNRIYGNN